MIKKVVSFTLTDWLVEYLDQEAEETGLSKSDIVRRAIEFYKNRK